MIYKYIAVNPSGDRVAGTLDASSEAAAEESLWRSGYSIVSLKKVQRLPTRYELLPSVFRVRPREVATFARQLAALLASGLTITSAIDAIARRGGNSLLKKTLLEVRADLEVGMSFSEASARHSRVFPLIYVRLVNIGEATGKIEPMLLRAATHLEKQGVLSSRIRKALTYPAFVFFSGLGAMYVLLTFSIPSLSSLFSEYGGELPAVTRFVMGMGQWVGDYGKFAGLALAALIVVGFLYTSSTRAGRRFKDRLALTVPVVKRIVGGEAVSRLGFTLSTLLGAGVAFGDSMELLVATTDNLVLKDALTKARAEVLSGEKLSTALARQKVFPSLVIDMVSIGEETGNLDINLHLIGEFYEKETEQAVSSLTTIIEPVAIIGVGGFVGFIAIVMISSIYGIISHIGA